MNIFQCLLEGAALEVLAIMMWWCRRLADWEREICGSVLLTSRITFNGRYITRNVFAWVAGGRGDPCRE